MVLLAAAPNAFAASNPLLPAAAQGHPYRHGLVPHRGQQALTNALSAPVKNLTYGGGVSGVGVTTGPPKVYLVFWGSQWGAQGTDSGGNVTFAGDPKGFAPYVQKFIKGLGTGGETWSGVMTQYCQGVAFGAQTCPSSNTQHVGYPTGGALAGVWADESAASPSQSTGHQLAQEAMDAAAHFSDYSSSSQFVIVSPTGTSPDGFATSNWCAWHDFTGDSTLDGGGAVTPPSGGSPVAFTNLPYLTDAGSGCGQNFVNSGSAGTLDGVSIVEGHEYAETITDTFPAGGWTDSSGNENGDKCAWLTSGQGASQDITLTTGTFAVQSTWANDAGACEVSHAIVTDPTGVTVTNPGTQTSAYNAPITPLQMAAQDTQSGQTFTWSATGLPAGLSIDTNSGQISGTPTTVGSSSVTVTATDTTNVSGSTTFTWTVAKRSTSSSVSCTPSTVSVSVQTTCTATVTDTDAGTAGTPTGSVMFSPSGSCTLAATGTTGVSSCQSSYTPTTTGAKTITASYGGDSTHKTSASSGFGLTVNPRSTSTSVSCAPATVNAGHSTTCTATVSDDDSGTASTPTGTVNFSAAPPGAGSFSASGTCTLTGTATTGVSTCQTTFTPGVSGSPAITAAYQGDSKHAGSGSSGFGLTVEPNVVSVSNPGDQSTAAGTPVSLTINGSDSGGMPLSYSASGLPPGLSIDASTGIISGTPTSAGATGVTVTATDSTSSSASTTFAWTVTSVTGTPLSTPSGSSTTSSPSAGSGQAPTQTSACPAATGKLTGATLGLVRLGMTRTQARAAYASSSLSSRQYQDFFCLTPSGVHVGYAWPTLGHKKLMGRVVWITTANPHYSAAGIAPGTALAKAKRTLAHAKRFGSWYLLPGKAATTLVKVKGGVVREVGVASGQLTKSKLAAKRLVRGLS